MEVDDSYRELGITRDSSDAEVKAAWRRLAARWHPDRNSSPAALRKIQRINRALEEIRHARLQEPGNQPSADERAGPQAAPAAGEGEPASGVDRSVHQTVALTLEEACAGCVREFQGEVVDDCDACGATGIDPRPCACAACEGSGQVRQPLWFGWLSSPAECAECQGSGQVSQHCTRCGGGGKAAPRSWRVRVRIPAGMREGSQLQVPARTRARGGPRGQALSLTIDILPHAFFSLDADGTVRCEVPVDGFAWMAERWTEVPTPAGLRQMRLRRGHLVYRIKGQGFPAAGGRSRADCMVTVTPLFPQALDAAQEALIDRLVASNSARGDTAAGERVSTWQEAIARWQQGTRPAEAGRGP